MPCTDPWTNQGRDCEECAEVSRAVAFALVEPIVRPFRALLEMRRMFRHLRRSGYPLRAALAAAWADARIPD